MSVAHDSPKIQNRLLASLDPADLALLSPYLKLRHLKQNVLLHDPGEPLHFVYFPERGMISLLAVMEAGSAVETATVGREGAVGVAAGLYGRIATGRAVIQVEGDFLEISASNFQAAVAASSALRAIVARYNDAQVSLIYQVAGCNALHQVTARLCRWLLQTRDRSESDVITLTHEFLSEMLGVQRSTVTNLARELQSLGLINYRRGRIEIVDRPGVERRACECYATSVRTLEAVFSEPRK